jgi:hypothetical protein
MPMTATNNNARWLLAAGLGTLALWVYWPLFDLALLGWDTWPMILTARVQSWSDLWGCVSESLMDGRYPHGEFYRPVTNLLFALDHALGGLEPSAYHRTDWLIHLTSTLLMAGLAARLCAGRHALRVAAVAGVLFCLHPIQLELITAPPRRADTLCLLFTLACLLTQPLRGMNRDVRSKYLGGLFAFLAVGSKETGAVVLPVVLAWHLCFAQGPCTTLERLRRGARGTLPVLVGVVALVAVRTLVLGGMGGPVPLGAEPAGRLELFGALIERAVLPLPLWGWSHPHLPLYAAGLLVFGAVKISRSHRTAGSDEQDTPSVGSVLSFLGLWSLAVIAITGFADQMHEWYALLLTAPVVLIVARCLISERAERSAALGPWLLIFPLVSLVFLARGWPLESTPRLQAMSILAEQDLRRLEEGVESSADGTLLRLNPWHPMLDPAPDGAGVRSLFSAYDYSLQAWCELRWPERAIEVTAWTLEIPQPRPGVLTVQLIPGPEPGWVKDRP